MEVASFYELADDCKMLEKKFHGIVMAFSFMLPCLHPDDDSCFYDVETSNSKNYCGSILPP